MDKRQLQQLFTTFLSRYDPELKDSIWAKQSQQFKDFWNNRIVSNDKSELDEAEIDQIIRILDTNARGNTRGSESVARAMIPQGAWRRMFRGIKERDKFSNVLNEIFLQKDIERRSSMINKLYELNEEKHINNLTGPSGNAVCTMLVAFDPIRNVSVISLNDRHRLYEFLGIEGAPNFDSDTIGQKIVFSNEGILRYFIDAGLQYSARTISVFLYSPEVKSLWKTDREDLDATVPSVPTGEDISDPALFYMESQLEDFLVENWDRTELGQKYDLVEEDGHFSQQYPTRIGKIDILAMDKKTKQYVVIELKKGQTSDDTVGQLTRYMGWLEEHKTGGKPTKGIIIAAQYDERLYYALKKIKDVEVYLYKVDFKLEEFKK